MKLARLASRCGRPASHRTSGNQQRSGFTLIEVVLAIALASVVMYLLTTAIELYMVRVDSSRTRVESAQLARSVLDQIANDLKAARYQAPPGQSSSSSSSSSGAAGDGSSGSTESGITASGSGGNDSAGAMSGGADGSGATGGAASGSSAAATSSPFPGISGTELEVTIERIASPRWDRALLPEESLLQNDPSHSGVTVRYFMQDGRRMLPQELAELGVQEVPATDIGGLYRESAPTATLLDADSTAAPSSSATGAGQQLSNTSELELLAPEVVELTFAYFDGETLLDEWDASSQGALPLGVEIRLKILELSYEESLKQNSRRRSDLASISKDDLVEYRRFVQLTTLRSQRSRVQQLLLPKQQEGSGQGGREGGGEGGEETGEGGDQQGSPGGFGGG